MKAHEQNPAGGRHVAIVRGGFAGLYAARRFGRRGYRVTLLDKRNFQLFQPLLYQVATGSLTIGDIAYPQRTLLRKMPKVWTLNTTVFDIDPEKRCVYHEHGELQYDLLVAATGVKHNYFGNDHWREHAPGLKTAEHAIQMRRRIFRAFEYAEMCEDVDERTRLLTFIVVGGGPTGVELAGALGELTRKTMVRDFRRFRSQDARIVLLEGAPDILPVYPASLRAKARKHLGDLGVEVQTSAMVEDVDADGVRVRHGDASERIEARTVLWAAGVRPSLFGQVLADATGAERDRGGRLLVNPDCSLPTHPNIFVIGDLASLVDAGGQQVPGLAPAAIQQGRYVAETVYRRDRGKKVKPFRYKDWGTMAVIGINRAVGNIRGWKTSGMLAWFLWAFVHIRALIDGEQRLRVFVNWSWKYFTRQMGDRLITGDPTHTQTLREARLRNASGADGETQARQRDVA
ncbi:MAG: NAD(P)/FAD-dependent oxidoreductase [Algiphilus sp.]